MATLTAKNLAKAYKGRRVVEDVSLTVNSGEIVGLLGPNGAGKTTTFYMVVGSIMEQALLPQPEDFPDAEERRLLYVALTRARHRVWLLFNKAQPSPFVEILQALDVPMARKP